MLQRLLGSPETLIIVLLWAVVAIYWAATALRLKPVAERVSFSPTPIVIGVLLLLVVLVRVGALPKGINVALWPTSETVLVIGDILAAAGCALLLWARRIIGRNWSSSVTYRVDHELVTTGPYGAVRHPIYSGFLLTVLGSALVNGHLVGVVVLALCVVVFALKMSQEEGLMMKHFPEAYAEYRKRVKALIPHVV